MLVRQHWTLSRIRRAKLDAAAVGTAHSAHVLALQDMRVDFQFSKGSFDFRFLPFTIPYPVPFKALGDETKARLPVCPLHLSLHSGK